MIHLGNQLKSTLNGERVVLLTSSALRARESAEMLGNTIGCNFEAHDVLWSDSAHRKDLPGVMELIRSKRNDGDVLILVTHLEYIEYLPKYFSMEEFGEPVFPHMEILYGEAWDIDCDKKTIAHIC